MYFAINADIKELKRKTDEYFSALESIGQLQRIRKSSYYYFNKGKESLGRVGSQGQLTDISVNEYRSLLQHTVTLICGQRPSFDVRATNTDYKSMTQAILGEQILEHYLREKKLERVLKQAAENAEVFSEGFIAMDWNTSMGKPYAIDENGQQVLEGDIEYTSLNPFQVIREVYKTEEQDWVIIARQANKHDLAARFTDLSESILNVKEEIDTNRQTFPLSVTTRNSGENDQVTTYLFMHKRCPSLPEGRYVLFVGDVRLIDTTLPYENIPVFRIAPANLSGTCLGYTPAFDLLPLQEALDNLYSAVVSNNLTFATQCLQCEKDNDVSIEDLGEGLKLIQSDKPVTALQLTKSAPETYNLIASIQEKMRELSGINQVIRGVPDPNLRSANALAIVSAQAIIFNSGLQQNYNSLIEDVGTETIRFLKTFATTPRFVAVVGKYRRSMMKSFEGSDLEMIDRVIVERKSAVSSTTAGQVELAQNLLQAGLIKRPEQYLMVMETGKLDPIVESELSEAMLIKAENELLSEGKNPPVIPTDDHSFHIREQNCVLANPEVRSNPVVVQAVLNHLQSHMDMLRTVDPDLLAIVKQQPLQPKAEALPSPTATQPTNVNMPEGTSEQDQAAYAQLQSQMAGQQ